jgi:hypothetical protein
MLRVDFYSRHGLEASSTDWPRTPESRKAGQAAITPQPVQTCQHDTRVLHAPICAADQTPEYRDAAFIIAKSATISHRFIHAAAPFSVCWAGCWHKNKNGPRRPVSA